MLNVRNIAAYRRLVVRVSDRIESRHERRFYRAIDRFWARLGTIADNPGILDVAGQELEKSLRAQLTALYDDAIETWSVLAIEAAANVSSKAWLYRIYTKGPRDELRNAMADWLRRNALTQATTINRSMMDRARSIIARGLREGLTINEIAERLANTRAIFSRRKFKKLGLDPRKHAKTIVRTEIARSQSAVYNQAVKQLGIVAKSKQWITVNDNRVRPTHRAVTADPTTPLQNNIERLGRRGARLKINNPRIPYEADFIVGGFRAKEPRDDRLPAKEVVNCRCTLAVFEEPVPRERRRRIR